MSSQAPWPPHPPPASPAIARVLPMVPEVSLFTPAQVLPLSRTSLPSSPPYPRPPTSQQLVRPHLLPPTSQVQPPCPHQLPSHHLLPQSDLSRVFLRSEATLFLSGGSSHIPARRVQFQAECGGQQHQACADQPHQAGAGQPHQAAAGGQPHQTGLQQAVDRVGQADRISFPHQVQQLEHHAVPHDQVQPLQTMKHQNVENPFQPTVHHNAAQQLHQTQSVPQPFPTPNAPYQLPPTLPPDIISVLTWQNDQLAKLQDQVARLLAASPQGPAQHAGNLAPGQVGHSAAHVVSNQAEAGCSPVLKRVSSPPTSRVCVSTSTSTLLSDMQTPKGRLSEEKQHPPDCLDFPDYPTTPSASTNYGQQTRRVRDMNTLDSPVLGESVSMYEGNTSHSDEGQEDVEEMYENILGQVKRLLAQDQQQNVAADRQDDMPHAATTIQHNIHPILRQDTLPPPPPTPRHAVHHPSQPADHLAPAPSTQSTTTATWDRLRQLGVSFISPSDLVQPAPSSSSPYNSIYLPQASIPSTTMISPDTSLAINNLALKYLTDAEMGRLAAQHNRQVKTPTRQEARPAEYSLASHQFLARYGLGAGHQGGQAQGVAGQGQDVMHHANTRPVHPHPITHHQPARPQHYPSPHHQPARPQHYPSPHHQPARPQHHLSPHHQPARPAAPAMDRVLDITAIRQQSKLW